MYKNIQSFSAHYFLEGTDERRALEDFMTCESHEAVNSLKNELTGIVQVNKPEKVLENSLGLNRKIRFGSYKEWAKTMLLWMGTHRG
jgi:hypothetical protein